MRWVPACEVPSTVGERKMGNFFDWFDNKVDRAWVGARAALWFCSELLLMIGLLIAVLGPVLTLVIRGAAYLKTGIWITSVCEALDISREKCSVSTSFIGFNKVVFYLLNEGDMLILVVIAGCLTVAVSWALYAFSEYVTALLKK